MSKELDEQLKAIKKKRDAESAEIKQCPNCGYCPTCGRAYARPYGQWPYYPTWPWYPPQIIWYADPNGTTITTNTLSMSNSEGIGIKN